MKKNLFKKISLAVLTAGIFSFYEAKPRIISASFWLAPSGNSISIYHDIHSLSATKQFEDLLKKLTQYDGKSNIKLLIEDAIPSSKNKVPTNVYPKEMDYLTEPFYDQKFNDREGILPKISKLIGAPNLSRNIKIIGCDTRLTLTAIKIIQDIDEWQTSLSEQDIDSLSKRERNKRLLGISEACHEFYKKNDTDSIESIIESHKTYLNEKCNEVKNNTMMNNNTKNELLKIITEALKNHETHITSFYNECKYMYNNKINKNTRLLQDNILVDDFRFPIVSPQEELAGLFRESIDIEILMNILESKENIGVFAGAHHAQNIEKYLEILGFKKIEKKLENNEFLLAKLENLNTEYRCCYENHDKLVRNLFNDKMRETQPFDTKYSEKINEIIKEYSNIPEKEIIPAFDWMFE